jgi:hypothetical protein
MSYSSTEISTPVSYDPTYGSQWIPSEYHCCTGTGMNFPSSSLTYFE